MRDFVPGEWLDWQGLVEHTKMSRSTLNHHLSDASKSPLPQPTRFYGKPLWPVAAIDTWLEERDAQRGPAKTRKEEQ